MCASQNVTEAALVKAATKALGLAEYSGEVITQMVERIIAGDNRNVTFILRDGREIHDEWEYMLKKRWHISGNVLKFRTA